MQSAVPEAQLGARPQGGDGSYAAANGLLGGNVFPFNVNFQF